MELGYKHFSHTHKLEMHEMPEGAEVKCSGCNSSANKTIYACWQCNFFLHEQCFLATRSKKYPSHPLHPLTLVPYPTYPSNSFFCNCCKMTGTGFSYSCSDCDFDLHVQCAYFISDSANTHLPNMVTSPNPHSTSYQDQEIVPQHFPGQNSSIPQNTTYNLAPSSDEQPSHHGKTKSEKQGIKHFSHPHGLVLVKNKHGKNNKTCAGCQETLVGKGYSCSEKICGFQLDEALILRKRFGTSLIQPTLSSFSR